MKECKNCGNCRHAGENFHTGEIRREASEAAVPHSAVAQNEDKFRILAPAHQSGCECATELGRQPQ